MTRREFVNEMIAAFRQDCNEILEAVESAEVGRVIGEVEFKVRRKALLQKRGGGSRLRSARAGERCEWFAGCRRRS